MSFRIWRKLEKHNNSRKPIAGMGIIQSFCSAMFLLFVLHVLLLSACFSNAPQEQPVRLIHADSLIGYTMGGDNYRELIGHVTMRHENTILNCDRAVQNLTQDIVDLYGNVNVKDDTLTLLTKQARYFGKTKIVSSDSAVYLNDRRRTLTADRGTYNTDTKVAQFYGDVFVQGFVIPIDFRAAGLLSE